MPSLPHSAVTQPAFAATLPASNYWQEGHKKREINHRHKELAFSATPFSPVQNAERLYALQHDARPYQIRANARKCGHVPVPGSKQVTFHGGSRPGVGGLCVCWSATCPVCADRMARKHRAKVECTIRRKLDEGSYLVTVSLRPGRPAALDADLDALAHDWHHLISGAPWARWRQRLGLEFVYGHAELHDGHRWRAEYRIALLLRGSADERRNFLEWMRQRCGGQIKLANVSEHQVPDWIAPGVLPADSIEQEGSSPWQLLKRQLLKTSPQPFGEWVRAVKNRRGLVWSAGLREARLPRCGGGASSPPPPDLSEVLAVIPTNTWNRIRPVARIGEIVRAAISGGQAAVDAMVERLLVEVRHRWRRGACILPWRS